MYVKPWARKPKPESRLVMVHLKLPCHSRSNRGAGGSNCCASSEREIMAFKALLPETMQLDPLISRQVCHRRPLQNLACSREPAMDDFGRGQEAGLLAVLHRTCVCRDMVNGQADDLMHLFMNIAQARPTAGSTARNASCLRKIVLCLQALCVTGADGVQRTMA